MRIELTEEEMWDIDHKMNKSFYNRKTCERCRKRFDGGRTMSMFNSETICLWCQEVEKLHPKYGEACKAEKMAHKKGIKYFCGIGVNKQELDKIEGGC